MDHKFEIYLIVFFISFLLFLSAVIILFKQYRSRQQAEKKEKEIREQLHRQELLSARLEIQQETMQEIGREIHDNVGQLLTLASLYTQQLAYENKAPQVNSTIDNISDIINRSLAELRRLSRSLTDNQIEETDMAVLLQAEVKKINELGKFELTLHCDAFGSALSYTVKNILLRIVQEFLQNSMKHAACEKISLSLKKENEFARLVLHDDGKGFDPEKNESAGIGIRNMKKRTALIGGSFSMRSDSLTGTRLIIEIPFIV